jgi:hypothetical protein
MAFIAPSRRTVPALINADTGRRHAIVHRHDAEHSHAESKERATTIDQRLSALTRALGRRRDRPSKVI